MDMGVKWVYTQVKGPGGARLEAGQRPCLCFKGRTYMLVVASGWPIHVTKRPVRDFHILRAVVDSQGKEYDVEKVAEQLQGMGQTHGITAGASTLLARALARAQELIDEDSFNDEEETVETQKSETDSTTTGTENSSTIEGQSDMQLSSIGQQVNGSKPPRKVSAGKKAAPKKAAGKKAAPKKVAKGKSAAVAKKDWPTPFRPGTMKEKAFLAFKEERKEYDGLEMGGKKEWQEKLAKKLGATPGTVSSWVNGPFRAALDKKAK